MLYDQGISLIVLTIDIGYVNSTAVFHIFVNSGFLLDF